MKKNLVNLELTLQNIKKIVPTGSTLYAVVKKVSSNKMSRQIAILCTNEYNEIVNISGYVADILNYKWNDNDSVTIGGCGQDMGFHIVSSLASILYNDGYAFKYKHI